MSNAIVLRAARVVGGMVLADNDRYTNRVEIRSETSDRLYVVAQNKRTKEWSCGCPGWIFHRHCKHLRVMLPLLTASPSAPALGA